MADSGTLVFTNPPSLDMRLSDRDYKYFSGNRDLGWNFYQACIGCVEVDLHQLEKWRLEEYGVTDASLLPPLPELDYRIITTPHTKAELIRAEADWRKDMVTLGPFEPPPS
jgi:hypothetical protein